MAALTMAGILFIGMVWYFGIFLLLKEDKKQAYINFVNRIGEDE